MKKKENRINLYKGVILTFVIFGVVSVMFFSVHDLISIAQAQSVSSSSEAIESKGNCPEGKLALNVWIGTWCIKDISEYISVFYRFFIGVVGIFAVAMIMWGGIKWLIASGNTEKISQAKDNITSAIIGVVIALVSYVLLNTINPMILDLKMPALTDITGFSSATSSFCEDMLGDNWRERLRLGPNETPVCNGQPFEIYRQDGENWVKTGQTCFGKYCPEGKLCDYSLGSFGCVPAESYCENKDKNACRTADAIIAKNFPDKGCAKRVDDAAWVGVLGVNLPNLGSGDECVYGDVIKPSDGYERISCFDAAAENICWGVYKGKRVVHDCHIRSYYVPVIGEVLRVSGSGHYCTENLRPVQGAEAICVKRTADGNICCDDGEGDPWCP